MYEILAQFSKSHRNSHGRFLPSPSSKSSIIGAHHHALFSAIQCYRLAFRREVVRISVALPPILNLVPSFGVPKNIKRQFEQCDTRRSSPTSNNRSQSYWHSTQRLMLLECTQCSTRPALCCCNDVEYMQTHSET